MVNEGSLGFDEDLRGTSTAPPYSEVVGNSELNFRRVRKQSAVAPSILASFRSGNDKVLGRVLPLGYLWHGP